MTLLVAATAAADTLVDDARQLTNPFADRIIVPFNNNPDFGIGGDNDSWRYTLTIQPVIPIHLSEKWNIISRTVLPIVHQDLGTQEDTGLGDTQQSFFLSPTHEGVLGWFWGVGPIFLLPTATRDRLGEELWGAGPTVGLLNLVGPWTVGALTNHIWSLHDDEAGHERSTTFLQPFIDYTMESGTTFSVNTESTYDWENRQWTVPVNAVVRQLFTLGNSRLQIALGPRYYFEAPEGGPEWGVRLGVTFLLPK